MKNKFISFVLSLMAVGVLAGCSSKETQNKKLMGVNAEDITHTAIYCDNCEVRLQSSSTYRNKYEGYLSKTASYTFEFKPVEKDFEIEYPIITSILVNGKSTPTQKLENFNYDKNIGVLTFTPEGNEFEINASINPLAVEVVYALSNSVKEKGGPQPFFMNYAGTITAVDWGDGTIDTADSTPFTNRLEHPFTYDDSLGKSVFYIKVYGNVTSVSFSTIDDSGDYISIFEQYNLFNLTYNIREIHLKDTIISIPEYAFVDLNGLELVTISKTVTDIKPKAFSKCDAHVKIKVDEDNEVYDSRDNCYAIIESDNDRLIVGTLNSTIPDTIKEIGPYAFYQTQLCSIVIPDSVQTIREKAFADCTQLEIVDFYDCSHAFTIAKNAFENIHYYPEGVPDSSVHRAKYSTFIVPICSDKRTEIVSNSLRANGLGEFICTPGEGDFISRDVVNQQLICAFDINILPRFVCDDRGFDYTNQIYEIDRGCYESVWGVDFGNGMLDPDGLWASYPNAYDECFGENGPSSGQGVNHFCVKIFGEYQSYLEYNFPFNADPCLKNNFVNKISYYPTYAEMNGYSDSFSIDERFFANYENLISCRLPYRTNEICSGAFENCSNLRNIYFANRVEEIYDKAFKNCSALVSVDFRYIADDSYSSFNINEEAFKGCSSLCKISFTNINCYIVIRPYAFYGCALEELEITEKVVEICEYAFANNTNLKTLTFDSLPEKTEDTCRLFAFAFDHCESLKSIYLPQHIEFMCEYNPQEEGLNPFTYCSSLESMEVNQDNKQLSNFNPCHDYQDVNINCIYEKQEYAAIVSGCSNSIPILSDDPGDERCYTIYPYAFAGASKLYEYDLKNCRGVLSNAFNDCSSLRTFKLSELIIGDMFQKCNFKGCTSLRDSIIIDPECFADESFSIKDTCKLGNFEITYKNPNPEKFEGAIFNPNGLTVGGKLEGQLIATNNTILSGDGSTLIIGNKEECYIPNGVEQIGEFAFAGATFEEINIPATVYDINPSAFMNCKNLKRIVVNSENSRYFSQDRSGKECNCIMTDNDDGFSIIRGCENTTFPQAPRLDFLDYSFSGSKIRKVDLSLHISLFKVNVGRFAFEGCTLLTDFILPFTVGIQWMGDDVIFNESCFKNCINLKLIDISSCYVDSDRAQFNSSCFEGCSSKLKFSVNSNIYNYYCSMVKDGYSDEYIDFASYLYFDATAPIIH